ncbi:MAG: CmcI family methyltransferase [Bryobacteraceae bacterium]
MASVPQEYHLWYYEEAVWTKTTFLGVPCLKSVSDMWNYQEILCQLRPSLVVEFGSAAGGSALFFAEMLKLVSPRGRVLSIDIDHSRLAHGLLKNPDIEFLLGDTTGPSARDRIRQMRREFPGNAFFILDSDHAKQHVLRELYQLKSLTVAGDYVVVEDGNINGHPVLPNWGEGPYEALEAYFAEYPEDYRRDAEREQKFGFTFAPGGFLIRR